MTAYSLIFTLAAIGISETVYLIKKRLHSEKPVCFIGDDCSKVLGSRYSKLFVIPNDVLGLLFYVQASFIAAFLVIQIEPVYFWELVLELSVGISSAFSILFTYIQAKVLKAWCFWCLISACTTWLMAVILILG